MNEAATGAFAQSLAQAEEKATAGTHHRARAARHQKETSAENKSRDTKAEEEAVGGASGAWSLAQAQQGIFGSNSLKQSAKTTVKHTKS